MSNIDLRGVLGALDELSRAGEPGQAAHAVLAAAVSSVGADSAVLTRIDDWGATFWVWPADFLDRRQQGTFEVLNATYPWPLATHTRKGPGLALRISDFWSLRQYRSSPMYRELFKELSVQHQVAFSLPTVAHHSICVALHRDRHDFTNTDCENFNALRTSLAMAAQRQAVGVSAAVSPSSEDLSPREREILQLTATGLSSQQIGRRLGISAHTVSKHLQHLYRKIGVTNRTEAANRAGLLVSPFSATLDAFTAIPA
ncbi:MAG: helix-turn-helix transcriptional regulator [Acidimicrobiaceae bacterium]|nr:helix-turn-helix transcriptional regulator [Acidimicrobiaceae bacterium]